MSHSSPSTLGYSVSRKRMPANLCTLGTLRELGLALRKLTLAFLPPPAAWVSVHPSETFPA